MLKIIISAIFILIWVYFLGVLNRSKLNFWYFIVGSLGLFLFFMILIRPVVVDPLSKTIAAMAGLVGTVTGTFSAFFRYGTIFVNSAFGAISLQIDFECSGIIEIIAYLSLLAFFRVYSKHERIFLSIVGIVFIMLANALRVIIIAEMIHFCGPAIYHVAHTIIGRFFFYVLSIILYFFVFTKPHIVRMKIGRFNYGHS